MSQGGKPRVSVTEAGPSACWTLAFQTGGQIRVATVVKATFVMAPDRPMVLVDPDPIVTSDRRNTNAPESSLLAATDLVPWRPRADVTLRGHAKAPQGHPTTRMTVRFTMARGNATLLDKRLVVQGSAGPSGPSAGPMPITSIPLVYEMAAGGPHSPDNPAGVPDNTGRWPNILDAAGQPRPVGFGPLSAAWPVRRSLWHAPHDSQHKRVPEFPADFRWEYFNAAPADQRVDYLQGDEWIGFEGMNSQIPRVQSCLPRARGSARIYGPDPDMRSGKPIQLFADTLSIDTDQLRCWVVWRGAFVVKTEAELDSVHVIAGVETPERPLTFPATFEPHAAHAPHSAHAAHAPPSAHAAHEHSAHAPHTPPSAQAPVRASAPPPDVDTVVPDSVPVTSATPFHGRPAAARKKVDKRMMAMRVFDAPPPATPASPKAPPAEETIDPSSEAVPSTPFAHSHIDRAPDTAPPVTKPKATMALDASMFEGIRPSALPFAGGASAQTPRNRPSSLPAATPFDRPAPAQAPQNRPSSLPAATPFDRPQQTPSQNRPSSLPPATPFDRPAPAQSHPAIHTTAPLPDLPPDTTPPDLPFRASAAPPEPFMRVAAMLSEAAHRSSPPAEPAPRIAPPAEPSFHVAAPPPVLAPLPSPEPLGAPTATDQAPLTLGAHFLAAMARATLTGRSFPITRS